MSYRSRPSRSYTELTKTISYDIDVGDGYVNEAESTT